MRHIVGIALLFGSFWICLTPVAAIAEWAVGKPMIAYWEGPGSLLSGKEAYGPLDEPAAKQLAGGGFNVVCAATIEEVQLANTHGLRTIFQSELLKPESLDGGPKQAELDALIDQYKVLPAAYAYHITDEPNASQFPDLGRIVAYLRQRDPVHLAYINLLPNNAADDVLGTTGYEAYLREFIRIVQPSLLSYDHYQFHAKMDAPGYLQNLESVAQAAKGAGVPFLNTVQACSYAPSMRVPTADETRFLVYSTLAYGAQGISYYHYLSWGPEYGGIVLPGGKELPLFATLQTLNRDFVAIAGQYQEMQWLGTYVKGYREGSLPPGTKALSKSGSAIDVIDEVENAAYGVGDPLKGFLIGFFGKDGSSPTDAECILIQNLDYSARKKCRIAGADRFSFFDVATEKWLPRGEKITELELPPGGGVFLRLHSAQPGK